MKKILLILLFFNLLFSNVLSIEPDVFVQSTVNRASMILSKDISKEEKISELKSLATDVVRKIEDVRRIYNELEIGKATGAGTRTNDTWITTQVKSKLLTSSDTPGRRVKVVTENSVVYLMGLLTEAEADRVALEAAQVSGAERVVQLFELIPAPAI